MSTAAAMQNVSQPDVPEVEEYPVTPAHSRKAAESLTKATSSIILDDPFYGALLLKLEYLENNRLKTTQTNGFHVQYNARYISELPISQIKGVLRHIVAHIAHLHHLRRGARSQKKWDAATDHTVNLIGREAGWDLPPDHLADDQYKDMAAEHIYTLLPDDDGGGDSEGDDNQPSWNFGGVADAPYKDESERRQMEQDTIQEVMQAGNAAKNMGKLPAYVERWLEELRDSQLPWRELLAKFFKAINKDDFSWNKANRRYLQEGWYLPALYSHNCGPVVLAIDTSGSIGEEELAEFIAELNGIIKFAKPSLVHVVYCDAKVQQVEKYTEHDDVRATKPKGGGGTAFEPVFEWVEENNITPECLIYLTDMYGSFPSKEPNYPTMWVSTSDVKEAPFGQVIRMN
jgi:predicted metal-dependent peptidase